MKYLCVKGAMTMRNEEIAVRMLMTNAEIERYGESLEMEVKL